ncbi:MAG: hypothetical protein ABSC34_12330 [Acidimicrobiales bacterium]
MKWKFWGPYNAEVDLAQSVAIFIDLLFAIVLTELLSSLGKRVWGPPQHGVTTTYMSHFAVAAAFTLVSWVAYHGTGNKHRFKIRFFNIQFFKFVVEILIVVVYFLMAANVIANPPSCRNDVILGICAFVCYGLWDFIIKRELNDTRYKDAWEDYAEKLTPHGAAWPKYEGIRVWMTWISLAVLVILSLLFLWLTSTSTIQILVGNYFLVCYVVIFRVVRDAKHRVSTSGAIAG